MKKAGISRPIDNLGRVVIPKEIRDSLMLFEGDVMEFFVEGRNVLMTKMQKSCIFCGNTNWKQLTELEGLKTCKKCYQKLKNIFDT